MSANNAGGAARLYDLEKDPEMKHNIAKEHPDLVKQTFDEYVLEDTGDSLLSYDLRSICRAAHTH